MIARPSPKPLIEVFDTAFAPWFAEEGGDFSVWRAFIAALTAQPMSPQEFALYRQCTGRTVAPQKPFTEAWGVVGRRGGKSRVAAALAVYCACHMRWPKVSGETLQVLVAAENKDQASKTLRYALALMRTRPALAKMIRGADAISVTLRSGIEIVCVANNFRTVRSGTIVCAILDEVAFWYSEDSANPDVEVYRAIRPGMATVPNALLIGISSPYAKRGLLFDKHRRNWGRDDAPVLVWQAPTTLMNPTAHVRDYVEERRAEDPLAAAAEYDANFRDDVNQFLARDLVERLVEIGVSERPPVRGVQYHAFCDPASGVGQDSMTLAIAHRTSRANVLDLVREAAPPFSPKSVAADFAKILKSYGCARVTGDGYARGWVAAEFAEHNVTYDDSERDRNRIYSDAIPHVTSGRLCLLDHRRLINQICALERKPGRAHDVIDHPRNGHDDVANAALGALVLCGSASRYTDAIMNNVSGPPPSQHPRTDGAPVPAMSWEQQVAIYATMSGR
jgi:hypothetical protein